MEPFSTRNPCLVLSLIPAMPHVGEVDSGIRPKVAFNESSQGIPPCEDDIKKDPDDGRLVGRIGVQGERVESEAVLIW